MHFITKLSIKTYFRLPATRFKPNLSCTGWRGRRSPPPTL